MTPRMTTLVVGIAFVAVGGIWILAQPRTQAPKGPPQSQTRNPLETFDTSSQVVSNASHQIGTMSISPPSIVAGSSQPVTITAQISDPDLIASSVELLQVVPNGQPLIIGQLNDNGQNGDVAANDGIFTVSIPFSSLPSGVTMFRVSAAFRGSLMRVQSPNLSLLVSEPTSTSSWTTLTDSQNLFDISVPAQWGITTSEVPNPDGDTIKSVVFSFPDGAAAFVISVYTPSGWADLQNTGFTSPEKLGQSSSYIFGWSEPQDEINTAGFTDAQIRSQFDAIRGTFRIQ